MRDVTLNVSDGHLVAIAADDPTGLHVSRRIVSRGTQVTSLMEPVAFFLPEHAIDPSVRSAGEELWMEDRAEDGTAAAYPAGHQTGRQFHTARYQMKDDVRSKPNLHWSRTRSAHDVGGVFVKPVF